VKISAVVDEVCKHAFNHGLNSTQLESITSIITRKSELDQTSVTKLIENLYPAQEVQENVVIIVVGCLGEARSKPSVTTQALLVKWLITVYEVLEDVSILSRLYGVLFNLLDMVSLR
jgi:centromere protein I